MQSINNRFKDINSKTEKVVSALQDGIKWIDENGDIATKETKIKLLQENKRNLNRVIQATNKRPSVAVFGQSQVGKSFLVRSLAKSPKTSKLEVLNSITQERIDFLQKINPPGGRESTGVITRFSTSKPNNVKKEYPYKVELLSQLDVASIIINGYLEDIQDYIDELDKEEILEKVASFKTENNNVNVSDLHEDEIYDFNDYLINNYKDNYRIKYCESIDFFNDLILLLPKIAHNRRWELLHFFWGKNEFLTSVFNKLSDTLNVVGFSNIAYVNDKAIINGEKNPLFGNTTNILDVERVKEMFHTATLEELSVCNEKGELNNVGVSEFSALIKELHFEIPNDFLEKEEKKFLLYTDILDFPGSKSRDRIPEVVFNSNKENAKLSMFVRGKVSYLFYLYNRDIGISTLLYCMDNEPPLVSESPGLLDKWIKRYIGTNPESRKEHQEKVLRLLKSENIECEVNNISPLLIAMTKFNVELNGKGGAEVLNDPDSHNSKWYARFKENFSNYMSKPVQDKWTENWSHKNEHFKFIFPIRDPGFSGAFFQGYEPVNQKEEMLRPEKVGIINDMETSFMNSKIANDFIFDKKTLWKELLTPNKTGIDYLCKYLEPSSHPINMLAQLHNIYEDTIQKTLNILESEYSSGNMDEDLRQAKIKGAMAFTSILSLNNNFDSPLSNYLKQIATTENEIWRLLYEFKFNVQKEEVEEKIDYNKVKAFLNPLGIDLDSNTPKTVIKQELLGFFEVGEEDLNEILKSQIGVTIDDLLSTKLKAKNTSEMFSDLVLNHWSNKLTSIRFKNDTKPKKGNNEVFNTIFSEILKSNSKKDIKREIILIIEEELKDGLTKEKFNLISSCITSILNRYVFSATWLFSNQEDKPIQRQNNLPIFSNESTLYDGNVITKQILNGASKKYISEFSLGVKELFKENVKKEYGIDSDFNTELNAELGGVINKIQSL
ncbi:virulence factor SrfC family protein [Polaribacter sp. PL03]|uniref:virulence factor SrfC family protein n=1 Tax=Polaribacter sp. PL03 TaxID=3088353 RepID=UPI0029CD853D|nr:virulence factor SrfC family protein [Polaribacter sp. PL03]MDX6746984.1 virulence factor SrfC family protein [Polaribacter sp. PL03]